MRHRFLALTAAVVLLATARPATAGYEFRFADTTGAYTTSFGVAQGSTVDVRVYLVATGGSPLADLRSYGVQLNYNGTIADVQSTAAIASNAGFTGTDVKAVQTGNVPTDFARASDATPGVGPYVTSAAGPDTNPRILLGTFTFTGISAGTTANVTTDPFPTFGNTVTGTTNETLDSLISNANATITVTAIPEPGTMLLTGLLASGIAGGAARRLRRKSSV